MLSVIFTKKRSRPTAISLLSISLFIGFRVRVMDINATTKRSEWPITSSRSRVCCLHANNRQALFLFTRAQLRHAYE